MYKFVLKSLGSASFASKSYLVVKDKKVRACDTFEGNGYALNQFGHIRNDFAVLSDQNNLVDMQRTLVRMEQMQEENSLPADATFEQRVAMLRPRWCQTPAELDRFEQYMINNALDFYNEIKIKQSEAGASLDIDNGNVSPVADSKAS